MRQYRNFVGFYWTLPLPSLGFWRLPPEVDEAAKKSRTIWYQRDRARAYVRACKGTMVDEIAFLEARSDRATETVEPAIERALNSCMRHQAQLLYVDFSQGGWRSHPFLARMMCRSEVSCLDLLPEPMMVDGVLFDPIEHFKAVKATADGQASRVERRAVLVARVTDLIAELRAVGTPTNQAIANFLNQQGVVTVTGKAWTAENVKQFIKSIPCTELRRGGFNPAGG